MHGSVLDPAALRTALDGVAHAYHLAAVAHLWSPDRADFDRVNRQGTEALLRAAAEAGVRRVIHCSTEAVLFPKRPNGAAIDETSLPPLSDMPGPYTRSKRLAEDAALAAAQDGLDVVIASPSVPIGPGDRNLTPPAAMLSLFLRGRPGLLPPLRPELRRRPRRGGGPPARRGAGALRRALHSRGRELVAARAAGAGSGRPRAAA